MTAADLRVAALAAFSHEIRTPLTALRMIADLATPAAGGGKLLDAELVAMLSSSLDELHALIDALQDQSRAERGMLTAGDSRSTLAELLDFAVDAAREQGVSVVLISQIPAVEGPWDRERLGGALAAIAIGVDSLSCHRGEVQTEVLSSSEPGLAIFAPGRGEEVTDPLRPAPFAFFAAITVLEASGWQVDLEVGGDLCRCTLVPGGM